MQTRVARSASAYTGARLALLGVLALLMLLPVTLPVAVLRALVHERFGVSELLTSLFMSINMVGAVLAAPVEVVFVHVRFHDRVDRAGLLAEAAEDALEQVDVVTRGAAGAVLALGRIDGDRQRRAGRAAPLVRVAGR